MRRIATPDELGRALEAGVIVKADLATAPTVTEPVAGTYVPVQMPPSAFGSVSSVDPERDHRLHHMEHRAPVPIRQDQLVDVPILRFARVLALEGIPIERETTRLGGHERDLSAVLAESNLDGLRLERRWCRQLYHWRWLVAASSGEQAHERHEAVASTDSITNHAHSLFGFFLRLPKGVPAPRKPCRLEARTQPRSQIHRRSLMPRFRMSKSPDQAGYDVGIDMLPESGMGDATCRVMMMDGGLTGMGLDPVAIDGNTDFWTTGLSTTATIPGDEDDSEDVNEATTVLRVAGER